MDDILLDDSLLQYLGSVDRPADPRRPAVTTPLAVPGDPLDIDLQGAYFDMKNDIPLPESRRWSHAHARQPSLAGSFKEYGNSPQSSGDRNADSGGGSGPKRGTLDGCNSGSPSNTGSGKSFKQVLAERNKQAQRRFRQRQKDKIEDLQSKLASVQEQRTQLRSRLRMLATALQLRKEELRKLRERQAQAVSLDEEDLAREFSGAVRLTVHVQEEVTLTPEQIKKMTDRDIARLWSQYVKELAVLLVRAEGNDPPQEVIARMEELVCRELLLLYIRAALTNMSNVKRFIATSKIENVRMPLKDEGIRMWRHVAEALKLSRKQLDSTSQLWSSFRVRLAEVFVERKEHHKGIAATMPNGILGQDFAIQHLQACELMDALKKNLRQEHVLIHEFLSTFYTQTLTPLQGARLLVKSFPWYPDIPAVCIWISALAGNKAALSELRRLLPDETIEP
ncbi:g12570 [Coccomyxa viridis]|uniref:G12570 protein n=1 Tax=Coccomyxa viridis TaxID=1274662 RepID=A0ABP1GDC6_9CHLO